MLVLLLLEWCDRTPRFSDNILLYIIMLFYNIEILIKLLNPFLLNVYKHFWSHFLRFLAFFKILI